LGSRKGIRPVKKLSGGMLAWLSAWVSADLHIAQLMPLLITLSAPVNPDWFYISGTGSPGYSG